MVSGKRWESPDGGKLWGQIEQQSATCDELGHRLDFYAFKDKVVLTHGTRRPDLKVILEQPHGDDAWGGIKTFVDMVHGSFDTQPQPSDASAVV